MHLYQLCYRRAEGSGPWLHPPRPARWHRSIGLRYILLAAIAKLLHDRSKDDA